VLSKFQSLALLSGKIKKEDKETDWTTPRFDWVDPTKDVQAEGMELGLGGKTWAEYVRSRGYDPIKLFAEIQAERKMFQDAGIPYPADNLSILGVQGVGNAMLHTGWEELFQDHLHRIMLQAYLTFCKLIQIS
jgi:hypothetical protein